MEKKTTGGKRDNKEKAVDFLTLVVARKIDEAYERYVDMRGKHHNVYFAKGFATLRDAMKENHAQFPDTKISIKNVIGEGDLVAVHSHVVQKQGDPGIAVVHILRFENEKIVEMWDCGQKLPADMPNEDGAF
jgi:predicted SnoaL-like aldol condensation-catalyzing enzyme